MSKVTLCPVPLGGRSGGCTKVRVSQVASPLGNDGGTWLWTALRSFHYALMFVVLFSKFLVSQQARKVDRAVI